MSMEVRHLDSSVREDNTTEIYPVQEIPALPKDVWVNLILQYLKPYEMVALPFVCKNFRAWCPAAKIQKHIDNEYIDYVALTTPSFASWISKGKPNIKRTLHYFVEVAARNARIDMLIWAQKASLDRPLSFDEHVFSVAAMSGNLDVLRWLKDNNCPTSEESVAAAVYYGRLDAVVWLTNNGCSWNPDYCLNLAGNESMKNWIKVNRRS